MKIFFAASKDFVPGLEVLIQSIKQNAPIAYEKMRLCEWVLLTNSITVLEDSRLSNKDFTFKICYDRGALARDRFVNAMWKLEMFSFSGQKVFMDADLLCVNEFMDFPKTEHLAVAADDGIKLAGKWRGNHTIFNSGFIVAGDLPSGAFEMMLHIAKVGTPEGGDQGVLNEYCARAGIKPVMLPKQWNTLKRIYRHHPHLIPSNPFFIHFVGKKPAPWGAGDPHFSPIEKLWTDMHNSLPSQIRK